MMNSPFRWNTSWSGIVVTNDSLILPNTWNLSFDYDIVSDNSLHKDIAMQRLDFMIEEKFQNSIWINFAHDHVNTFYHDFDAFVVTLPEEPYDSLIAITALLKAQSMTNGIFDFHSCRITSKLGYNIENYIEMDEATELVQDIKNQKMLSDPWFLRPCAGFTDLLIDQEDETVLIKDSVEWSSHDLNWNAFDDIESHVDTTHRKERWIPLVIKGGAGKKDDDNDD